MGREAADSPASWGELLNSYRQTAGSRSLATVAAPGAAPAVRYAPQQQRAALLAPSSLPALHAGQAAAPQLTELHTQPQLSTHTVAGAAAAAPQLLSC